MARVPEKTIPPVRAQETPVPREPPEDVRAARPYLLSRAPLRNGIRRVVSILTLAVLDLAGLTLGVYGALALRAVLFEPRPVLWGVLWREGAAKWLPFLALLTFLTFWRGSLYAPRERREGPGKILSSLVLVAALAAAFGVGTGHDFGTFGIFPTAVVLATAAIAAFRWSYESVTGNLLRIAGVTRRAVLVGESGDLAHLHDLLGRSRGGIDYDFVGVVSDAATPRLQLLGGLDELRPVLSGHEVDELIVADSGFPEAQLLELVEQAHRRGVKVRLAPKTTELLVDRGEYVPGQGTPLFELKPPVFAGVDWATKRAFDILVGMLIVLVGLPLWVAIGVAIKLTSRGPVFYGDERVGLGERTFRMLKFRTMYVDAERRQAELEGLNEASGALFKIRDDPRVTAVGRLLRRLSIDEFPNVINVLRGEMSLVGPRPLPIRDYALLEPWHRKRYLVLPGMTGIWQISGRSELSFDDLVRLDFYYLDNWSIWLDISILLKTLPAVIATRGAY